MAVVTDILETILALRGAAAYVAGMGQAKKAVEGVAEGEKKVEQAGKKRENAGGGFSASGIAATVAGLAKTAAIAATVHRAFQDFSEDEKIMRSFALTMRNLGRSADVDRMVNFAQALSNVTGIDDEQIVKLEKTLVSFGVSSQNTMRSLEPILNIAEQFQVPVEQVAEAFGRANLGITRGLRAFGIQIAEGTKGTAALNQALAIANVRFVGLARANLNTVAGSFQNLRTQFDNMLSSATRLFGPVLIKAFNFLAESLKGWMLFFDRIADALGIRKTSDISDVPGAGSVKGDPKQTALLGEIANNTEKTADSFVRAVLGGKGDIARRAGTWRDAGIAFGF